MDAKRQGGFNLLELLVTLLVVAIVLGLGVPNFMEFLRNHTMTSAANDLVAGIHLARTEAVKRQVPVTLCTSTDATTPAPTCGAGPGTGFIVFVDDADPTVNAPTDGNAVVDPGEAVLLQHAPPGGTIVIASNGTYLAYGPNGFVVPLAPGQAQRSLTSFLLCDERGNRDTGGQSTARAVNIAPTGRAQIMRSIADVATAVAVTGGVCS